MMSRADDQMVEPLAMSLASDDGMSWPGLHDMGRDMYRAEARLIIARAAVMRRSSMTALRWAPAILLAASIGSAAGTLGALSWMRCVSC